MKHQSSVPTFVLLVMASGLLLVALLYTPDVARQISPFPAGILSPRIEASVTTARLRLLLFGLMLLAVVLTVLWSRRAAGVLKMDAWASLWTLAVMVMAPLAGVEIALRPFLVERAKIFVTDDLLGWKLKPGSSGTWGATFVEINSQGRRGPEYFIPKPEGVRRILVLGDSVTFGFSLEDEDTYPYLMEKDLATRGWENVEVINAGVGGYSPWQEYEYLRSEGERYEPNLVIVGFVLNDVNEKFMLKRFGGNTDGFQLMVADRPLSMRIGIIFYPLAKWILKQASSTELTKEPETLQDVTIAAMIRRPEAAAVQEAWTITLENLEKIVTYCQGRRIPLVLVAFPFTFQLAEPELDSPQRILAEFSSEHGIPFLDLLPILIAEADSAGRDPHEFFLDVDHLSPSGTPVAAAAIVDLVVQEGWLEGREDNLPSSLAVPER